MSLENKDALRCVEVLMYLPAADAKGHAYLSDSSAHIRRLVAENEAKDALLRQAVEALEKYDTPAQRLDGSPCREPIDKRLCAAIRQHLGQKGETG